MRTRIIFICFFIISYLPLAAQEGVTDPELKLELRVEDFNLKGNVRKLVQQYKTPTGEYSDRRVVDYVWGWMRPYNIENETYRNQDCEVDFNQHGHVTEKKMKYYHSILEYENNKLVTEKWSSFFVLNTYTIYYTYENERLIERKAFYSHSKTGIYTQMQLFYDNDGKLIEFITKSFNNKGKPKPSYGKVHYTYNYDSRGNLIEKLVHFEKKPEPGKTLWHYDSAGNIVVHERIRDNNKEFSYIFNYDEFNRRIEKKGFYNIGHQVFVSYKYSYDEQGNVQIIDIEMDKTISQIEYKYQYDEHGNWTREQCYHNGKLTHTVTRTITYW